MPTRHQWLTIPNAFTIARIVLAPISLWVAYQGEGTLYKWLFAVAVLTDAIDGTLARLLKAQSVLGARLDAFADTLTYIVLFFAVLHLWPEFVRQHSTLLETALIAYALNHAFAFLRFRKLPAYHTWAGKASAVLMAVGILAFFLGGPAWIFTVALSVSLVSVIEQFTITAVLRHWATDVPTIFHAWRWRRGKPNVTA